MSATPRWLFPGAIVLGTVALLAWRSTPSATSVAPARPIASAAEPAASFPTAAPVVPPSRPSHAQLAALEQALRHETPDTASALATLRAWAEADPVAALAWARACAGELRLTALIAVLEGAAQQPELAVRLTRDVLRDEPELAGDCGTALVGALIRRDAFGVALEFARQGPREQRAGWLASLFGAWAEREPAFAGELATLLGAQGPEGQAYQVVVERWAAVAPAEAAAFALNLPSGAARSTALRAAVSRWAAHDPAAVAAALPRFTDPTERDAATVALVCATDALNRPTPTALAWAEAIASAAERQRALTHVLLEWTQQDRAAAERYLAESPRLSAAEREALHTGLQPKPQPDDT